MRIASWNINGLRARIDFLSHWLKSREPDLVGVQELKVEESSFPYRDFEAQGYYAVAQTQKAWNGVAILSRQPAELKQQGLPGQEDFGARLVSVRVENCTFVNIYCPNGKHTGHEDFPRKLAWLDDLMAWLDREHDPGEPLVLGGDFNLCPSRLDTWNEAGLEGQIFHTQEERSRFQRLLDWGLIDSFREKNPDLQKYSWWDYRSGAFHKNQGLRIDFLMVTRPLMERVQRVEIDRDYRKKKEGLTASDHAPVIADLV